MVYADLYAERDEVEAFIYALARVRAGKTLDDETRRLAASMLRKAMAARP